MKSMKMWIYPALLASVVEMISEDSLPITVSTGEIDSEGYIKVLFEYKEGFQFSEFFDNAINKYDHLTP